MTRYSTLKSGNSSLRTILHACSLIAVVMMVVASIGCCGPIGIGCRDGHCNDCDGTAGRPIAMGPLHRVQNFKRSLVCGGGGCGETYIGEWISTPPDCSDPCCDDQFVGGATKCRPFCRQPGSLLGRIGLYGQRHCDGAASSAPCGCDSCVEGYDEYNGEEYIGEYYQDETSHDGGCATCATKNAGQVRYSSNSHLISNRTKMEATSDPGVQRIRR